jgi:type II secretory ATPase GspE/PulE/Tfp pilus assembly ATPase PilB-like protein
MHAEPYLIASTVTCIVGQRVVRKICPTCKTPRKPSEEVFKKIQTVLANLKKLTSSPVLYYGQGCKECNNTGYLGRVGIFEVLVVSEKIGRMILARETAQAISAQAVSEGMVTMKQDGFMKVLEGATTIEEVLRVAED